MIIGIDCDNVLNNLTEELLKLYNRDSGDNLQMQDILRYRIDDFVVPEYKERIKDYFLDKEVWKNIKLIEESQYYVGRLVNDGHRVMVVTATEPHNFYKKEGWLKRNFPELDLRNNLICIKNKQLLKIDVLIDDYSKNLSDVTDDYGNHITADYIRICFDYPWNHAFKDDGLKNFKRSCWEDIYSLICRL